VHLSDALAKLTVVGLTMTLRNAKGMIYFGVSSSCPSFPHTNTLSQMTYIDIRI
jgi:hypothetical protein